jgi:purine nucleosidase
MQRIHLDTDIGGDPDDLCALAMLLGWPDVRITGITTTQDDDGQRAGYVRHVLKMLGREEIPVASGARRSMTTRKVAAPFTGDTRYWPEPVKPALSEANAAIDLLETSIRGGATVICIGPVTNIAMFEMFRGDILKRRKLVVMGGYIAPPGDGFPAWGPEHDWNIQWDTRAMEAVLNTDVDLTIAPFTTALHAPLRERDLARIEATGPLGSLIARQSRARAEDAGFTQLGRDYAGFPDDLVNVHYDPVAVAAGLDWDGVTIERMRLMPYVEDGVMTFEPSAAGREVNVVTDVDGAAFSEMFLDRLAAASR